MKRVPSIRIYALAVCFVSVICVAITSGFALYNLVSLALPDLTIGPYRIQGLTSNEEFRASQGYYYPRPAPFVAGPEGTTLAIDQNNPLASMSDAEITALREQRLANEYRLHRLEAVQGLLREAIIILISSVLFFVHWRLAKTIGAGQPEDDS